MVSRMFKDVLSRCGVDVQFQVGGGWTLSAASVSPQTNVRNHLLPSYSHEWSFSLPQTTKQNHKHKSKSQNTPGYWSSLGPLIPSNISNVPNESPPRVHPSASGQCSPFELNENLHYYMRPTEGTSPMLHTINCIRL